METTQANETALSKNAQRNVDALKLTEKTFKEYLAEKGVVKALHEKEFNAARREYNAAANLMQYLVATGIDGGKGKVITHYGDPERHKAILRGSVKEDSALFKAMEFIRAERTEAFFRTRKESLLPSEVELTDAQWCAIALAQRMVPMKYREATPSGDLRQSKATAEKYCLDFKADITAARHAMAQELEDSRKQAERAESDAAKAKEKKAAKAKEKKDAKAKEKKDAKAA